MLLKTAIQAKEKDRSRIKRQEKEFLANGGEIKTYPSSLYDQSLMNYRELDKRNYARKQRGEI